MEQASVLHDLRRVPLTQEDLRNTAAKVVQKTSSGMASLPGKSEVTPKAGKPHSPFRRIVKYERKGPFYRQVGERWLAGESFPIMQAYYKHKYLHATKGWREYTGGPRMSIPHAFNHLPARLAFYGKHAVA
jgi:hypothetical protein